MNQIEDYYCTWSACREAGCHGCGPSERLKTLITARPLCHVEMEIDGYEMLCFLYDCEDLYPDTQVSLMPRLVAISKSKDLEIVFR